MSLKNIIMSEPKKKLDKDTKIVDNISNDLAEKVKSNLTFEPTVNAYVPFFNEERQRYDIIKVLIDPRNDSSRIERIELKTDSEGRAIAEMQHYYAQDHLEKLRKK